MKKIILCIFALFFLMSSINAFATQVDTSAEDITAFNNVVISGGSSYNLCDENKFTKIVFNKGDKIKVSNEKGIKSIYIIWDQPVGEWDLTIDNKVTTYGKYGFIHEYIEFDKIEDEFIVNITSDNSIVCDIYAFSDGEVPSWVQKWQPPYERADMLLYPTHADDEMIFFGGTIPYYAGELGLKVQVVYMTNHWGEPYRPHEMLDALWGMGDTAYPVISEFPDIYSLSLDHAKTVYNYNDLVEFAVEIIRRFKPMVIIGHDLNGEYGHGGHMICSHTLVDALELSGEAENYPNSSQKYGAWDVPKTYLHLYEENKISMNWDIPLSNFDGKTAFEMAEYGFSFHKSQQQWYSVKKTPGVYDCQAFGLYRTTVGADIDKNDFFENVTLYEEIKPEDESNVPDGSLSESTIDDISIENNSACVSEKISYTSQFYIFLLLPLTILAASAILLSIKRKNK